MFVSRLRVPALTGLLLACSLLVRPDPGAQAEEETQTVEHYLPFPAGYACTMCQGNDQGTHRGEISKYAFDFDVPTGTKIVASADGVVVKVREDQEGPTGDPSDNNWVEIEHTDGTWSVYHHLRKDGAVVEVGDEVWQGDLIAYSGNSGQSSGPHLHYGLEKDNVSLPCRFADVKGNGIPRNGQKVTSRNASRRPVYRHFEELRARYTIARSLDCLETLHPLLDDLTRQPPPPAAKALLEELGKYRDYRALYEELEAKFLAACALDREEALAAVRKHAEAGEIDAAVLLASLGRYEFRGRASREAFDGEIAELKKRDGYAAARSAADRRLAFRKKLLSAFKRQTEIEKMAARGRAKASHWRGLQARFRSLEKAAPTPEIAARLSEHVKTLAERADG